MQLQALAQLLGDSAPHSGQALADHFGVTRAAIWKRIEELRAQGLPIEAAAGQGYRLAAPIEWLDPARILAELSLAQRRWVAALDVAWEIDSTNSELLRRDDASSVQVCIAERQSAGRGRRGRAWISPLGSNVYFSLRRRFEHGMAALSGLSLAAGVALARALADVGARGFGLKWPNDLLADGHKLAGILVELGGEFLGPCHAVIGIGINVALPTYVGAPFDQPVTDLAALCAAAPSRNRVAGRLLAHLLDVLDRFERDGFAAFRDEYAALDLLAGRRVRVSDAHGTRAGTAIGVDVRGALRVEHEGVVATCDSAEVTVRGA